jgi:hypothetical protein
MAWLFFRHGTALMTRSLECSCLNLLLVRNNLSESASLSSSRVTWLESWEFREYCLEFYTVPNTDQFSDGS